MEKYEVHVYTGTNKTEYKIKGILKIDEKFYQFTNESGKIIALFPIKKTVVLIDTIWN